MKVCANCFADKEIKGFISSFQTIGECKICLSSAVHLIDLKELLDFFQELIDNFEKSENGEPLRSKIQANWSFFSSQKTATEILNRILPEINTEIISSDDLVEYSTEITDNYNHWETVKEELKWTKRFFINIEDLGWDGFFNTQYKLKQSDRLFRARVHHTSDQPAIDTTNMLSPPRQSTLGGRANPMGIPYLYLSDNEETVLYEVRASYLDELSIGTFQLKPEFESLKIVDFTEDTSLFQPRTVRETIMARLFRDRISIDLSKPMRRYDSEIEYIPTQFICEFIKVFTGAGGIRFRSSLHPDGKNIVLFEDSKVNCVSVKKIKITSLRLRAVELKEEL
ncbi:RES family NAD+ phosphorylase [Aequorivita viscosa]|uniref:RES domain-containing protein n=1 Tax=Aequorivita viscosa TaxID=797419 RepID=A0A1M6M3V5_9FLAO|nr:RES family NAD+ phosphorylase [Aequorivita viscosa]SDX30732.1 RES domain-containing protein [Aequorivita viscosa]SHJ78159.1 RES domain-containing protein [Aequorivita viscosa]